MRKVTGIVAMVLVLCVAPAVRVWGAGEAAFVHPGLLHTRADLERMRAKVAAGIEPWKSGFEVLARDRHSAADWRVRGGFEKVTRGKRWVHNTEMVEDSNAAYQNALMGWITGDAAHARKAIAILNAWSKLKTIDGHDAALAAGLNGFKLVSAAELMRNDPQWSAADQQRFKRMLHEALLPPIRDFCPDANGNWGAACTLTTMSIGVFCNDRELFDRAVANYRSGAGNGALRHYILTDDGECEESGRDQQHTQLGLGLLAEACQVAWSQGVDLYGEDHHRLLQGFEYTAKYNLGETVPFVKSTDISGHYVHRTISTIGRGDLRPIYEMVWNHYEKICGIPAPWTERAAAKIRPEGAAFGSDHPGFGTLLFSR